MAVSARVKQSVSFGTLLTAAIGLITFGVAELQANPDQWYIGVVTIVCGLLIAVVDTYVLKGQE